MLLVAMTLLGYFSYKQLPVELLPNTELPQLYITANSRSDISPSYMEQQVVIPLEGAISAVGGVENGASYNQPKIQQSSVSSNTWYTVTYGDNTVAFKTPTISTGGGHGGPGGNSSGLVISAPITPSLAAGNNVTDGTSHFEGNCYVGGGSVGIDDVETDQQIVNDPRVFTLDGRCLGTEVPATFRGVYIQYGKKHIKLQ